MRNGTGEFTTARQWGPRVSKASRPFLALATGILVIVSGDVAAQNPRDAVAADKPDGLDEVVVTGSRIARPVLDLPTPVGVVSAESLAATLAIGHMTFFSRSKQRLWTKGEQSGNVLAVQSISATAKGSGDIVVYGKPAKQSLSGENARLAP